MSCKENCMYGHIQINQVSVDLSKKKKTFMDRGFFTFPLDKYIIQPPISLHDQSELELLETLDARRNRQWLETGEANCYTWVGV